MLVRDNFSIEMRNFLYICTFDIIVWKFLKRFAILYRSITLLQIMTSHQIPYGAVRSVEELGRLTRAHRKQRKLTLETISGIGNLSTRFLSEFERGKKTAELGKVLQALHTLGLEVVIQPRGPTHTALPSTGQRGQHD